MDACLRQLVLCIVVITAAEQAGLTIAAPASESKIHINYARVNSLCCMYYSVSMYF